LRVVASVIPAQAGNQFIQVFWFTACAGMTWLEIGKLFRTQSLMDTDSRLVVPKSIPC
jgi:hypothetical protein